MGAEIVTSEDLEQFRQQLLADIKAVLAELKGETRQRWLKSFEVMTVLKITKNTLQTFRKNGFLPYKKIGGMYYYDYYAIQELLSSGRRTSKM